MLLVAMLLGVTEAHDVHYVSRICQAVSRVRVTLSTTSNANRVHIE